jgi:hypothetical protein
MIHCVAPKMEPPQCPKMYVFEKLLYGSVQQHTHEKKERLLNSEIL